MVNSRTVQCHVSLLYPQWESQHAGLSCEQYQSWKRENDPEYQRQGLAGYLRDNGISKDTHTFDCIIFEQQLLKVIWCLHSLL